MSEFATHYRHVSGSRFRIQVIYPENPVINEHTKLIFLHEGLGCIEIWQKFPQKLCELTGVTGIVYDRKGYGGSEHFDGPWTSDYHHVEASRYLPEILKVTETTQCMLIGHSDGATIALLAAALNPDLVAGVISEAAHIFVEQVTIEGIRNAVHAFERSNLKSRLQKYHKKRTETVFYRWANTWLDPKFSGYSIEPYLPQIHCPVLVIQGNQDEYGSENQVNGIVRGVSGPVTVRMIPNCGHVPHHQAAAEVLPEMVQFIRKLTVPIQEFSF